MMRIALFLATNVAVLVVMSIVLRVLGIDQALATPGRHGPAARVLGGGRLHRRDHLAADVEVMAKMSTGAQVITGAEGETQRWLVDTVKRLADKAGIGMPEVAVYEGAPNAFATGAFKNSALVAVSTGPAAVDDSRGSRGGARP